MVVRLLAATVAGGIAFFILGFVLYGLLLDPMVMKPNAIEYAGLMKDPPMWVPLVLANFVSAFLLAYIFDQWANISTFRGGLKGGAIVWFLISLSYQLMFLAFMNFNKNYSPMAADVVGAFLMGAVGGGVIGAVLGMMKKGEAA